MVGGGSGGHIFPLIAVQQSLAKKSPDNCFIVVSDGMSEPVRKQFLDNTIFLKIKSGKIRRFAQWRWWEYAYPARYKFYLLNLFDMVGLAIGIIQSIRIISKHKPDVIFAKGGYVSVPIGLAAGWLKIPYLLHESDTRPGLAGRVLRKHATEIAQGLDNGSNNSKVHITGIPVRQEFFRLTTDEARRKLQLSSSTKPILVVTCGSLGARRVNKIIVSNLKFILENFRVIHITGLVDYDSVIEQTVAFNGGEDYQVYPFIADNYPETIKSADLVISRAGATTIAELAAAAKPTIFIPNSFLTDQVSNSKWLESRKAGIVLDEEKLSNNSSTLKDQLINLLNPENREVLAHSIKNLAQEEASDKLAELLISIADRQ